MKAIVLALVFVVAGATAAEATCVSASFEDVLGSSNTVWWVTVTGTQSSRTAPRGEVLDVTVSDALKGPGSDGVAGRAYLNSCGPFITAEQERRMAESMVGRSFLFMGTYVKGVLSPDSTVVTPSGMSEEEKYQRALVDLHLAPPPAHRRVLWLLVGVAVALLMCAVFAMRARAKRSTVSTSEKDERFRL